MYFDVTYIYFVLPALIIALIAQANVKSTYAKYSKVSNMRLLTAYDVARRMLDDNDLHDVQIERVAGELTDHYDPRAKVVRLSTSVYDSTSVAAIGVAAHEVGHAIQYSVGYIPIKLRMAIIPVTRLGSNLAFPLAILGIILSKGFLIYAGILLFVAVVIFQLVTLPVEFNASTRAMKTLDERDILYGDELTGARKTLTAAALTYVAALAVAIGNLLRLLSLTRRRR
ncbi:MAG TPA: zinc metallopeptidase [Oscillospiraceae bacterium]|nr:zinc metallopeptidase [Oscillospiraceae bacterium]